MNSKPRGILNPNDLPLSLRIASGWYVLPMKPIVKPPEPKPYRHHCCLCGKDHPFGAECP